MQIDSYDTPGAEELLRLGRARHSDASRGRQLLATEAVAAAVLLAGSGLLVAFGHATRSVSAATLCVTVVAYLVAGRVRYPVGSAWTAPTQLVFVPMLFVLPTPLVPLIVAGCTVADVLPQILRGDLTPTRLLAGVADGFYALGPALVLVLLDGQDFAWRRWPLLLLAFGAQAVFDAGAGLARTWFAERIPPSLQLPMVWLYITDACLACVALPIAAVAVARPGLVLLALPLVGLLWLLARERRERLHYTLALTEEHRIAVELQRGLLPKRLPDVDGVELIAHYEPAGHGAEAGGDWYDAFALPDGRIGIVVGDVTGRGIAAASTMGQLRNVTRAFALADEGRHTPGEVLARLNRYELALGEQELFTLVYAIIDPPASTVTWAGGGHPPPLLRSAAGDTRFLQGGGAVMGVWDVAYEDAQEVLCPGDVLVFYTDGLVERRDEPIDVGLERLSAATAAGPELPSALGPHLLGALVSPTETLRDDVTTIVVRIGADRTPAARGMPVAATCSA